MRHWLLLLATPLWAADDTTAILKRLIEAQPVNNKRATQYTYVQETQRFTFDKDGKPHQTGSVTHDVLFVEGLKYEKLVARNGQPLSPKEQSQVEKAMRQTAEERRRHLRPMAAGGVITIRSPFSHHSADLGSLVDLLTFFDNRLVGQEEIRGHKTWVIESTPQQGHVSANEHEKQILGFRKKFWVDQAESVLVRGVYTVIEEQGFLRPGSTLTFEYEKIDPDVWQTVSLVLEFSRAKEKVFRPTGRTAYLMDKFHKFDVQSTITVVEPDK